ncbi:hypothetical protein BH11PSE4_BH11PSE4_07230 [soil metagenome]
MAFGIFTVLLLSGPATFRPRHIDATPFAHAPCSVLDGEPCTPSSCSVFDRGPCIPEIDYSGEPAGDGAERPGEDDAAKYQRPDHDLDTPGDLFAMLRSCCASSTFRLIVPSPCVAS